MTTTREELEQEIRDAWQSREEVLEAIGGGSSSGNSDLDRHIPEIDSKEVAAMRPIFESHLDVDFDPSVVESGGYDSIDSMIDDVVPPHIDKHNKQQE